MSCNFCKIQHCMTKGSVTTVPGRWDIKKEAPGFYNVYVHDKDTIIDTCYNEALNKEFLKLTIPKIPTKCTCPKETETNKVSNTSKKETKNAKK